jgi:hypothetical protein
LTKKTQSLATFVSHFLLTKEKLSPHNPMTTTTTTTTTRLEKHVHSIIKRLIFLPQGQLSNNNKKILELSYRTLFLLWKTKSTQVLNNVRR